MTDPTSAYHLPVLLDAVRAAAAGARRAVDATLGDGGHAEALLAGGAAVLGIDRDPTALARARERLGDSGIRYLESPYAAPAALDAVARFAPDFILLDLGVSSRQLDEESRGFTFRPGAPLDMRMGAGASAATLLAEADEAELTRIFGEYGDERRARRLAREVVRRRRASRLLRATTWSTRSAARWAPAPDPATLPACSRPSGSRSTTSSAGSRPRCRPFATRWFRAAGWR